MLVGDLMKIKKNLLLVFISTIALFTIVAIISGCKTTPNDNKQSQTFSVVYTTDGNGTISGNTNQTLDYGANATVVTAVPNEGYKFVKWSDTGSENPERTDCNVTKNITAEAQFVKLSVAVKYETDGNGTISGNANQTVDYGENATAVTAVPNEGYRFVKWSDTESENPERADCNVTNDLVVTAIFEKIVFNITYCAGIGGTIDGIAEQEVSYGEDSTFVVAVPNIGYKFVRWSDGNGSTIRQETNVTFELNITAEFEFLYESGDGSALNPFTITTYSQLNNMWYYPDSNYTLLNDLDLTDINHEPIFDEERPFSGRFNGNNHTIKNLTIFTDINFPSLFGFIGNGSVSYLDLVNVNVKTANFNTIVAQRNYCVGAIAGVSFGFLHDITVSGEITADELYYDGIAIGGLVGMAYGTIANCKADVKIEISNAQRNNSTGITMPYVFGGLIGVSDSAFIRECNSSGAITVEQSSIDKITVGGLMGYYFTSREAEAKIRDCITDIEIFGDTHYYAGGFIGQLDIASNTSLQILNCIVYGDITMGCVGGFICRGSCYGLLNIEKCHTESEIQILSQGAGFIYRFSCSTSTNSVIKECYSVGAIIGRSESSNVTGFGHSVSGINVLKCFSECNITATYGVGFIHSLGYCNMEQCYYSGNITCKSGSGFLRGVSSCIIKNCYTNANISQIGSSKLIYGFTSVLQYSELVNCYCAGGNFVKIVSQVRNSDIINFHTIKPNDEGVIIGSITDDIGIQLDITEYQNIDEMYYLAEKLNKDLDEEVWVNVENDLPKLNYNT